MDDQILPKKIGKPTELKILVKELEEVKLKIKKNYDIFDSEFQQRLSSECTQEEIDRFSEPDNMLAFMEARISIGRLNSSEKRHILESILIQKIKSDYTEAENIAFNNAIKVTSELSTVQIKLLVVIEAISPILCSVIKDPKTVENVEFLNNYLQETSLILLHDIKYCEQKGLLFSTFPKELVVSELIEFTKWQSEPIKLLAESVIEILSKQKEAEINIVSYSLSMVGKIIANTQINLIGTKYTSLDYFKMDYSDFMAHNIIATGSSSAYGVGNSIKSSDI